MKNFVKALDKEGRGFAFLHQKFQRKCMEKMKVGIFDSPWIRELIKDTSFDDALNPSDISAWLSLRSVTANFLCNHRSSQFRNVVDELMENFLPNWCMDVSLNAFPLVSSGLFFRELWRLPWQTGWALSPRYQRYGETLSRPMVYQFFWPTTAGAWRGMWSLLSTKESPWRDHSFMSSSLSSLYSSCCFFKIFCKPFWINQPNIFNTVLDSPRNRSEFRMILMC